MFLKAIKYLLAELKAIFMIEKWAYFSNKCKKLEEVKTKESDSTDCIYTFLLLFFFSISELIQHRGKKDEVPKTLKR